MSLTVFSLVFSGLTLLSSSFKGRFFSLLSALLFTCLSLIALQHVILSVYIPMANKVAISIALGALYSMILYLIPVETTKHSSLLIALFFLAVSLIVEGSIVMVQNETAIPVVMLVLYGASSTCFLIMTSRLGLIQHLKNEYLLCAALLALGSLCSLGEIRTSMPLIVSSGLLTLLSVGHDRSLPFFNGIVLLDLAVVGVYSLLYPLMIEVLFWNDLLLAICFFIDGWQDTSRRNKVTALLILLCPVISLLLLFVDQFVIWVTLPVYVLKSCAILTHAIGDGFYYPTMKTDAPKDEPISILGEPFSIAVKDPTEKTSGYIRIQGEVSVLGLDRPALSALCQVCCKSAEELTIRYDDYEKSFLLSSMSCLEPDCPEETQHQILKYTIENIKNEIMRIRKEYQEAERCQDDICFEPLENRIYRRFIFNRKDLETLIKKAEHEQGKHYGVRLKVARLLSSGVHVFEEGKGYVNEQDIQKALILSESVWKDGGEEGCLLSTKIKHAMGKISAQDCERALDLYISDPLIKAQSDAFLYQISSTE